MKSVFLLQHMHVISDDNEDVKVIGVYASKKDAISTIQMLSSQPGFSQCSKLIDPLEDEEESGFYLDEYEIGKNHWSEGFSTMTTIYVKSNGESPYACVNAAIHPNESYEICCNNEIENETNEFKNGDFVKCIEFESETGISSLLATEKIKS